MKKTISFVILTLFILLSLTGCSAQPYSFKQSIDEIESIQLVSAENSLNFTVIKTLSKTEKKYFLEQMQIIKFRKGFIGDPPELRGDSIKITYKNGDYEIICWFTSEYVKNEKSRILRMRCGEEVFNELFEKFLQENISD